MVLAFITALPERTDAVISQKMVHPGGFEPPTARFVAEYSIQLSYGCIGKLYLQRRFSAYDFIALMQDGASGRIRTSDRSVRSRVLYPAELRMHRENLLYNADSVPRYLATLNKMVHPGGFEPPTARFVAEYSIQLSYGCIGKTCFTTLIQCRVTSLH